MEYMGFRETEKVAENPKMSSFGCRSGGLVVHRNPPSPCHAADEIMNKLANTQLEENSSTAIEPSESSSVSNRHHGFDASFLLEEVEMYGPVVMEKLAILSLDHYRRRQGIELDLVEVVCSCVVVESGITAYHISSLVIPKNDNSGSPKKFYTEVCKNKMGETKVTFCDIRNPSNRARINEIICGQKSVTKRWNKCQDFVQL